MEKIRFTIVVDVHLLLRQDDRMLLLLRQNTSYEDGKYHLPAGHMEDGEKVTTALIREAKEEIGIEIAPEDVKLAHIMHSMTNNERMGFFFEVKKWEGEITNREPEKCSGLTWFSLTALPKNMVEYARYAVNCYIQGELLSEYGWK